MKKYISLIVIWLFFIIIAITLWLILDNIFYLINFLYIGTSLVLGVFFYTKKKKFARNIVQFAIGLYMLIYLGFIEHENMQIEGFWYYLFSGVFEAAVIHYLVAKIIGPLLFGRGWCGYACWPAMILDLLPYKTPTNNRIKIGFIKYIIFTLSLIFVSTLFILSVKNINDIIFISFIVTNILYYITGIVLALILKDNRAFCKYICPVAIFLKPASYFSLMRVKVNKDKCISCKICEKKCPMNVEITNNSRNRINGTECILCMKCIDECPKNALKL